MTMPPLPLEGGCQCGHVRYTLTAAPLTIYACHCTDCQTQSTAAFGMSMPVPRESVECDFSKLAAWDRPAASGRIVAARFCKTCGTRVFHEPSRNPAIINVKPGTLDDTSWVDPVGHLWLGSAQPWFHPPPEALTYKDQPKSFEDLFARFAERMSATD